MKGKRKWKEKALIEKRRDKLNYECKTKKLNE